MRTTRLPAGLAALAIVLGSCAGETPSPAGGTSPGRSGATTGGSPAPATTIEVPPVDGPYDWTVEPTNFVEGVDNPYFPLSPGTVWISKGESDGEPEVVTVRVTNETKDIMGVASVVVRDTVRVAGEVTEDTFDWYAQDVDGNVWYMGE